MSAGKARVRPKHTEHSNAFTIAEGAALSAKDCELILRALDALDGLMQAELANEGQDAAAIETRSRILIVRAKLRQQAAHDETAATQLQMMKGGIATVVERLAELQDDLGEVGSFVFVCIQALRAKGGDDANPDIATVLDTAYEKLVLDAKRIVWDALKALEVQS